MRFIKILSKELIIDGRLLRVARVDAEGYQFIDDPELAMEKLRGIGRRIDLFTFIQRLSDTTPRYQYRMEWDNMAVLPLSTFDDWISQQIDFKVRNKVRKSTKAGIVARETSFDDDFVKGISAVYNESPVRQKKHFWHYNKPIDEVRRMNATYMDQSIFIGAYLGDEMIGFAKLVTDETKSQAGLMQILSMMRHRDKAATNALIAQAVRSCCERGISNLWYANFSYGRKQDDSLADFKRHNGFKKVDIPRYYVPLTAVGEMAYRLRLHRTAKEWIPEPVAAAYRWARAIWVARPSLGAKSA